MITSISSPRSHTTCSGIASGWPIPTPTATPSNEVARANAADPATQRFKWEYDGADRKRKQIEDPDDLALTTSFDYDEHDNLDEVTSPRGNDSNETETGDFTTSYEYDRRDLMTAKVEPLGRRTEYRRRADGRVSNLTSPRGTASGAEGDFTTQLEYDAAGDLQKRTQPRHTDQYGPTLTITYNRNDVGDPTSITDARGNTFTNRFLDSGELEFTNRPSWWIYDAQQGAVRERSDGDPPPSSGRSDLPQSEGAGDFGEVRPQRMPHPMPRAGDTTITYDGELQVRSIADAAGTIQSFDRDALGRLVKHTTPYLPGDASGPCQPDTETSSLQGPIVMRYAYDFNGNQRQQIDGRCQETLLRYDQFDRLVRTSAPAGWDESPAITELGLDRNGNIRRQRLPRDADAVEQMSYDSVDRLISKIEPFDTGEGSPRSEWRYRYDANNNQTRIIRPRSQAPTEADADHTTTQRFDRGDQLIEITEPLPGGGDRQTNYGYDRDGNQTEVLAPGAARSDGAEIVRRRTRREFDGRGLQWIQTTGSGSEQRTTITEYDGQGNLRRSVNPTGVDDPDSDLFGDERPRWADQSPITASSDANRHATVREYDANGLMAAQYLPWGATNLNTDEIPSPEPDAQAAKRYKRTWTYNERGWPSRVGEVFEWTGSEGPATSTRYGYLPTGWISESTERIGDADPTDNATLVYGYDRAGNQTLWETPGRTRRVERRFRPDGQLLERKAIRIRPGAEPDEARTYSYEHNPAGELTRLIDNDPPHHGGQTPAPRATSITRDVAGRATRVNETWNGGRDTRLSYVIGGLTDRIDVDGRLDGSSYVGGRSFNYAYDSLDRLERTTLTGDGTDRVTRFSYWPSGSQRLTTKTNGSTDERFFATDGRISNRISDPASGDARTAEYRYDLNGNRTADERGTYVYNPRDQLVSWEHEGVPGGPADGDPGRTMTYRPGGDGAIERQVETVKYTQSGISVTQTNTTDNTYVGDQLTRQKTTQTIEAPGAETPPDEHRTITHATTRSGHC